MLEKIKNLDKEENAVFSEFKDSVIALAKNLPQWNSNIFERRIQSSISSLFEEAGELCGLVSKYRTRKNYFNLSSEDIKNLSNFDEIKEKFIDETGDFLWVLVCSTYALMAKDAADTITKKIRTYTYSLSLEESLYDIIREVAILQQSIMFENNSNNISFCAMRSFENIYSIFRTYLDYLKTDYDITLEDVCKYNMNKLGVRYDDKGNRLDGK